MKLLSTLLLLSMTLSLPGQDYKQLCDTDLIYEVVNIHIKKVVNKKFDSSYLIIAQPYSPRNPSPDTTSCLRTWQQSRFATSKCRIIQRDSSSMTDNTASISQPLFSSDMKRCRIISSAHHGEWGGSAMVYYYRKRSGTWKLKKSRLVWIS